MAFQRSSLFTLVICVSHRKYKLKETEGPTQATESVGSRMDGDPVSSQTEGTGSQQAVPVGWSQPPSILGPPSTEHREETVKQS